MTGKELLAGAKTLWGERGVVSRLAREMGVDRTQIWRWSKLKNIPGPAAAAMTAWLEIHKAQRKGK